MTKFIGVDSMDWSDQHVVSYTTRGESILEPFDRQSIDDVTAERLRTFYDSQSHVYYDHVAQHGFWGCRPAIDAR